MPPRWFASAAAQLWYLTRATARREYRCRPSWQGEAARIANLVSPVVAAAVDHRPLRWKILAAGNEQNIREKKSEFGSHDAMPPHAIGW
jgi:hypothetical protein